MSNKRKKCSKCKKNLPIRFYSKDSRATDMMRSECKLCHAIAMVKSQKRKINKLRSEYNELRIA